MSAILEVPAFELHTPQLFYSIEDLRELSDSFEQESPQDVLRWALSEFGDKIAIATGFGPEGMALLDMAAKIKPSVMVFYLDTDLLFPATYELRARTEVKYGLKIIPHRSALSLSDQAAEYGEELWKTNPDLCCKLRKLDPLKEALVGLDAWITAIRRDQSPARASAGIVERDRKWDITKINPLAKWSKREVWDYIIKNGVDYNPLHDVGFKSIGCTHCTRAVLPGEDDRAGRWSGFSKTECGLHG